MLKALSQQLKFLLYLTLSLQFSSSTLAAEVMALDQTLHTVADRSYGERQKLLKVGMQEVLVKNSGSEDVLINETVLEALSKPSSYVRQYGYVENTLDGEKKLSLKLNFDRQRIIELLRDAQLPVWGKQRPTTLMWVSMPNTVITREGQVETQMLPTTLTYQIISDTQLVENFDMIELSSARNGVPLLFPLMDLDDSMQVDVNDIRGSFTQELATASKRYNTDYFVVASFEQSLNAAAQQLIQYRLSLFKNNSPHNQALMTIEGEGTRLESLIEQLLSSLRGYFSNRYAITSSDQSTDLTLSFVKVNSLSKLVELERFLQQLSAIKSSQITQLDHDGVDFKVELFGSKEELIRLMDLHPLVQAVKIDLESQPSELMEPSTELAEPTTPEVTLNYYWKG